MLDNDSPEKASPDSASAEEASSGAAQGAGPRLNGVIDVSRPGRVAGWAIDRSDASVAVDVEIFREGRLVATVRADRHREDLVKNGIGTGKYGFVAEIDPPVEPGMGFAVTAIARAADGTRGSLRSIGKAAPSSDAERRVSERIFEEVLALRADVARLRRDAQGAASPEDAASAERLREMLERIEVMQARIEETGRTTAKPDMAANQTGLRTIAVAAFLTALGSLALGIYSMLAV